MTSAIDTNVIVSLWDEDLSNLVARNALDTAMIRGAVVVSGAVYTELMGGGRVPRMLDEFFDETGIEVDWAMDRAIWERAGVAYRGYVERRRRNKAEVPKSILADFIIGAHASRHGHTWVTLDERT
jgi:predicted nucleic acid-binding protein